MELAEKDYAFSKMSTVVSISIEGFTKDDLIQGKGSKIDKLINQTIEKKVKEIIGVLKTTHEKFKDPDFGPNDHDELGVISLYGNGPPEPAGTNKYPSPESIRWDRPLYADKQFDGSNPNDDEDEPEEEEEEDDDEFGFNDNSEKAWCMNGDLFIDGSSSGDVVQGKLGDCWFLGALSVLATQQNLLEKCFWRKDAFKEYGMFVCVFYKDCALRFVIIDDRIPVFASSGKVVFAQCKDPNELWVPLIEKAYAKIHGNYKALIGGYVHYGLADLTGYAPRLVGMKDGYMGYSDAYTDEQLWRMLERYSKWKCLMGTSIQSKPGETQKVESNAGQGLKMGHAYSLLAVGKIKSIDDNKEIRLVKLRNPWGFGEWEGPWSDSSPEREKHAKLIETAFKSDNEAETNDIQANDGTFFMKYEDWRAKFTSLFVAINFPDKWERVLIKGQWTGDTGGPREMATWMSNPKIRIRLPSIPESDNKNKRRPLYVGLYIHDTRLTLGKDYYTDPLYKTGIGFDIVTEDELKLSYKERVTSEGVTIPGSAMYQEEGLQDTKTAHQPPYMFGAAQVEVMLETDKDYYIIPSLRKREQPGVYFVQLCSNGNIVIDDKPKPTVENEISKVASVGTRAIQITQAQFAEKIESVRERILNESQRLGLSMNDLTRIFRPPKKDKLSKGDDISIPRTVFKRKLLDLGFSLAELPDEDFVVLDKDNSGDISISEFIEFLKEGLALNDPEKCPEPPPKPIDDLIFQPIDLEGVLSVVVGSAKGLRKAATWFSTAGEQPKGLESEEKSKPNHRVLIKYDAEIAAKSRTRIVGLASPQIPSNRNRENTEGEIALSPIKKVAQSRPGTAISEFNDAMSVHSAVNNSETKLKTFVNKLGKDAGSALYSDPLLQQKEVDRTYFLAQMRQLAKNVADNSQEHVRDSGILIVKDAVQMKRKEPRKVNNEIRQYLGLKPIDNDPAEFRQAINSTASVMNASQINSRSDATPLDNQPRGNDLWDFIIDRVIVLSECQSKEFSKSVKIILNPQRKILKESNIVSLSTPRSNIPTPSSKYTSNILIKGTISTPKGLKKSPGIASINTLKSQVKQKATIIEARDILNKVAEEISYCEIFRRIITVPVVSLPQVDTSLGAECIGSKNYYYGSFLKSWFEFFDKNSDGQITLQEFSQSLSELNVILSKEDSKMLFNRFELDGNGLIDWTEFMHFFENKVASEGALRGGDLFIDLRPILHNLLVKYQIKKKMKSQQKELKESTETNFFDISSLESCQVDYNVGKLKEFGVTLDHFTMSRLSRTFKNNLSDLINFCENFCMQDLFNESLKSAKTLFQQAVLQICGTDEKKAMFTVEDLSEDALIKIWARMAPSIAHDVDFEEFCKHFSRLVLEVLGTKRSSPSDEEETAVSKSGLINGYQADILSRILCDDIICSYWNKYGNSYRHKSIGNVLINQLSFSGFQAFIKSARIESIERKLKAIQYLKSNGDSGLINFLVHCYVPYENTSSPQKKSNNPLKDHLLLIAIDPLSSNIYKIKIDKDNADLPFDSQIVDMIRQRYNLKSKKGEELPLDQSLIEAAKFYNPWETPVEDQTIMNLCSRLRVVNTGSQSVMIVSEDPKFTQQLRVLLEKSSLPFFVIVNEVCLRFELSKEVCDKAGSMQKVVFGTIRKNSSLANFLMNVTSTLRVILRTYDSDQEESLEWSEMLAYINGNRNPFVTVQLLPKYVEPVSGMIKYIPKALVPKYQSAIAALKVDLSENDEDDSVSTDVSEIQSSDPDVDGGTHPTWEKSFKISFRPPSLTNCPLLFTDIIKIKVDDVKKYLIVMVREAKDKSIFTTAHDPRTATEYMLFGGPPEWCYPNITTPEVFNRVFKDSHSSGQKHENVMDSLQKMLTDAINLHDNESAAPADRFHVGFAITPRLLVSVYNKRNKSDEELLGFSQVSISSVLSGTGNNITIWSALQYEQISESGSTSLVPVGQLNLQLGFNKLSDIEAAKAALAEKKFVPSRQRVELDINSMQQQNMPEQTASRRKHEGESGKIPKIPPTEDEENEDTPERVGDKSLNVKASAQVRPVYGEEDSNENDSAVAAAELKRLKEELQRQSEELRQLQQLAYEKKQLEAELKALKVQPTPLDASSGVVMEADSFETLITKILGILSSRVSGKESQNVHYHAVLRPLGKILSGYESSKEEDGLVPLEVERAFNDILLPISQYHAETLVQRIGKKIPGRVLPTEIIHFLKNNLTSSTQNQHHVEASSHKHKQPKLKNRIENAATEEFSQPSEQLHGSKQDEGEAPHGGDEEVAQAHHEDEDAEDIDWENVALPDETIWERRKDRYGRTYYVNHAERRTQWNHPLQPPITKHQAKDKSSTMRPAGKSQDDASTDVRGSKASLNKTAPQPSRPLSSNNTSTRRPNPKGNNNSNGTARNNISTAPSENPGGRSPNMTNASKNNSGGKKAWE